MLDFNHGSMVSLVYIRLIIKQLFERYMIMTILTAKQFLSKIDTDLELQNSLTAVNWNTNAVTRIAASSGFSFTDIELQSAIDEVWGALNEDELRMISGGGNGNGNGPVDPISGPGNPASGPKDGPWSPPPGEVSDMSCFFGG
jgi:predicted ribosomally synthesized peptide with nif11-like leader